MELDFEMWTYVHEYPRAVAIGKLNSQVILNEKSMYIGSKIGTCII